MKKFIKVAGNAGDAITGERIFPGEEVFDTGIKNTRTPWIGRYKTRVVKEETIVWLAEQAGYTITKRDAGNSGDAKVVDGADVSVGDGEVKAGKPKAGGKQAAKRRSDGPVEGE